MRLLYAYSSSASTRCYRESERDRKSERVRERESLSVCLPLHLCAWVCFGGVGMFRYNVLCVVCVVVLMCLNLRSYGTSE